MTHLRDGAEETTSAELMRQDEDRSDRGTTTPSGACATVCGACARRIRHRRQADPDRHRVGRDFSGMMRMMVCL